MTKETGLDTEKTKLRLKLKDVVTALKKLANVLLLVQSEKLILLAEPQIIKRLIVEANALASLESLEGEEGEVFAAFLKSTTNIIQTLNTLNVQDIETKEPALRALKNLETKIQDLLPIIISIDQARKKMEYETFGSLLQRLVDAVQEVVHITKKITIK